MRPDDILDSIGNVDDTCIERAKEKKKARRPAWIAFIPLAACLVLAVLSMARPKPADPDSPDAYNPSIGIACDTVWIYFVDGDTIRREQQYHQLSADEIFCAWREKNGIGDEVAFVRILIESNGGVDESASDDFITVYKMGDYFIYQLTISREIENYYHQTDPELLLESLRRTMTEYAGMEYDEYHLILE